MRLLPALLILLAAATGCGGGATVRTFNHPYERVVEAVRESQQVTYSSNFFGHRVEAREVGPGRFHLRSEMLKFVDDIDVVSAGDHAATVTIRTTDHRSFHFGHRDTELEALALQGIVETLEGLAAPKRVATPSAKHTAAIPSRE
jgi:hypothetical protein